MSLKKGLLQKSNLYLILDAGVNSHEELFEIAKDAIAAGVDIVQLRDKFSTAKEIIALSKRISRVAKKKKALVIINDRADLVFESGADGLHLGQGDLPLRAARRILGDRVLIGISCQNAAHLRKARQEGADYIGFGSFYKTKTKPGRKPLNIPAVGKLIRKENLPVFAIGGISLKEIPYLKSQGIRRVAVCRAVCASQNVKAEIQKFKTLLNLRG